MEAKFLCLSQARTWIWNVIGRGFFCVQWLQLRWEVIVRFVDISWIDDHHCLNFLFIIIDILVWWHFLSSLITNVRKFRISWHFLIKLVTDRHYWYSLVGTQQRFNFEMTSQRCIFSVDIIFCACWKSSIKFICPVLLPTSLFME
jgi:hypothetical protein